mmetsp:Transcript_27758/g.44091  ORF Transcript_27758/g.44091 Transcript_27758/m.44091 type:complete len:215 (-) Transcript_27758:918-1562(-)
MTSRFPPPGSPPPLASRLSPSLKPEGKGNGRITDSLWITLQAIATTLGAWCDNTVAHARVSLSVWTIRPVSPGPDPTRTQASAARMPAPSKAPQRALVLVDRSLSASTFAFGRIVSSNSCSRRDPTCKSVMCPAMASRRCPMLSRVTLEPLIRFSLSHWSLFEYVSANCSGAHLTSATRVLDARSITEGSLDLNAISTSFWKLKRLVLAIESEE